MLAVGETVADAFPTGDCGDGARNRDGQAQQNADDQKDKFNDTEDALHERSLPENGMD